MMKEGKFDNPIYSSCNGPMVFTEGDQESLPAPCNRTHLSEGWKYINSSLYYISTEMKSWDESRPYCQRKGLDLVTINSEEEQTFLLEVVSAKKLEGVWIDLSPNNTKEISTRLKRGAGSEEEDCAKLTVYETPAVKEVRGGQCGTQKYCICEKYLMSNTM
ncbi:C-type lectin domain family 4 member F-like isoform X2 [Salmo trutta]|uniref:C-type lectin domain family 4 member F-like isoform X2 n=1 Tax=Salmo trutta TaxID=8032 RepID=UPI0011328B6B|nr:C-type lectin domain family 4 member F-like isoform X2 [Salmo trutta]